MPVPFVRLTAEAPTSFDGDKTSWHGFDRYDFLMDGGWHAFGARSRDRNTDGSHPESKRTR